MLLASALLRENASMLVAGHAAGAGPGAAGARLVADGSLAGALAVLELGLGGLAIYLVRNLLRRDVRL